VLGGIHSLGMHGAAFEQHMLEFGVQQSLRLYVVYVYSCAWSHAAAS